MVSGGDRPKTQKSILKVEDSIQYTTIERDNVVPENNLVIHSNVKVENDDQSKLVFRQPAGGIILGGINWIFRICSVASQIRFFLLFTSKGGNIQWSLVGGVDCICSE